MKGVTAAAGHTTLRFMMMTTIMSAHLTAVQEPTKDIISSRLDKHTWKQVCFFRRIGNKSS